jgi:hypothetical protein
MWHLGEVGSDPGRRATGEFTWGQPLWTGLVLGQFVCLSRAQSQPTSF